MANEVIETGGLCSEPAKGMQTRSSQKVWCALFAAVICAVWFHGHFRLAIVDGESMLPSLGPGDLFLVNKRAYWKREPRRGEIVLARYRRELIVKRVVGLPGEQVEVRQGCLYINGQTLAEPYAIQPGYQFISRGRLVRGRFALLGDNRALSAAQALHAVVDKEHVLGKVVWSISLHSPPARSST